MESPGRRPEPWAGRPLAANAHVLVGAETYTELSLRCARHDEPGRDGRPATRSGEDDLVEVARYATALARALAAAGTPPTSITVDADLRRVRVAGEPMLSAVALAIRADVPGLDDEAGLARVATATASRWATRAVTGPEVDVRVTSALVRTALPAEDSGDTAARALAAGPTRGGGARRWRRLRARLSVNRPSLPRLSGLRLAVPPLRARRPPLPRLSLPRVVVPRPAVPRPALPRLAAPKLALPRLRPPSVRLPRRPARPRLLATFAAGLVLLLLAAFVGVGAVNEQALALLGLGAGREAGAASTALGTLSLTAALPATEAAPATTGVPLGAPAPEPTAAPLPSPTPTTAVAPTTPPSPTPVAPRLVLQESFAGTSRLPWPNDPAATAWLAADGYHLLARQPGQFVAVAPPGGERLRDVVVTATFQKVGGPLGGGYGIIVRDQGPGSRDGVSQGGRYYVLEVGDRGQVGMWRRAEDHWVELIPWTAAPAAQPGGAENQLTARAIGQDLTLLVNGTEVATREDTALADGTVGVFLGGDKNEAVLKRLVVQAPAPRRPAAPPS